MLEFNELAPYVAIALAVLLLVSLGMLFFASRKSQKIMKSLLKLMLAPEKVKVAEVSHVVGTIMGREVEMIESSFKKMAAALEQHIARAENLDSELGSHNEKLVSIAGFAYENLADINEKLQTGLGGFKSILESNQWQSVSDSAKEFQSSINELMGKIDNTVHDVSEHTGTLQSRIDGWIESGKVLSEQLQSDIENNTSYMNSLVVESDAMREKMDGLSKSVADGFAEVKKQSGDYEIVMTSNEKLLSKQLEKMEAFTKQAKSLLVNQMNTLTNTANAVGGQIRLAESSIEKQERMLRDTVEKLMESAQITETFVGNVSTEISALTGKFQGEVNEFAGSVVDELKNVYGVANATLDDTRNAATAFSESVKMMAMGVRDTLIEMNTAHTQLAAQSENLIKMSADTTQQLQPLSELIERYYTALPDMTKNSAEMTTQLSTEISGLDDKLRLMKDTVQESIIGIADSSLKLENLAGQSRQQMIDLLSDYAKAVDTMQTLNRQMVEARASAPMQAISAASSAKPAPQMTRLSSAEFIAQSERLMERLHELSVDLTRAVGAEIPNAIWDKYHGGDKTIFSKWFAKMLSAADKRRVRNLFKADAVFRSQATQFVRGFSKMLAGAEHTDNKEMVVGTLLKTDLGQMYMVLKSYV